MNSSADTPTLPPSPSNPQRPATGEWTALFGARWPLVLVAGLVLVCAVGAAVPLADADLGMHLRVGEWIIEHGTLPRTEPFAWTRQGAPYFAYSWLAESLYFVLWRGAGAPALQLLNGMVLLGAAVAAAVFTRCARHRAWTTVLLVAAHVVVVEYCAPALRPQQLLAVALPLCWAATAWLATGRRAPWPYVLLGAATALVANTHLFAPACASALAFLLPARGWRATKAEWARFAGAAAAIGTGLMCTPYAPEWPSVYRLYLAPTPLLRFPSPIAELVPGFVDLSREFGVAWFVVPALALLPWIVQPGLDAPDSAAADASAGRDRSGLIPGVMPSALLWLAGLLFFGLATRGLFLWWLVCFPLVAAALARLPEPSAGWVGRALRAGPLVLFAQLAVSNVRLSLDARAGAQSENPRRLPNSAARGALWLADTLDRFAPGGRGRVVTTFDYGNALVWRLPRYSMSLDGRAVFPDSATALDVFVAAWRRPDTLHAPLANADLAVLPAGHVGLAQVARTPGWTRVARVGPMAGVRDTVQGDTAEVWARTAWVRRYVGAAVRPAGGYSVVTAP